MKQHRTIEMAIGLSVAAHLVFFGVALVWWLPGAPSAMDNARKMFNIRKADLPEPSVPRRDVVRGYVEKLKFENPQNQPDQPAAPAPTEKVTAPRPQEARQKSAAPLSEPTSVKIKENLQTMKEPMQAPQRRIEKDAKLAVDAAAPSGREIADPSNQSQVEVPAPFTEEMFAFTPEKVGDQLPMQDVFRDIWKKDTEKGARYGALDHFMNIQVTKWRDPQDGRGYFELEIVPGKDAWRLKSMPKEVVFLVDASLSIRGNRIEEFSKGVSYALKNLNKGDRYNVYTFKDNVTKFSQASVDGQSQDIGPALRFLRKLEPSESTDINRALLDSTAAKPTIVPSYIVLLSDGRPTFGVTDSARVIEEISRVNSLRRSVFALSGGNRVNRYLLDFLTYQNRGWSEHAPRTSDIPKRVADFYDKIKDPLLINLRYQFADIDARETFPKHLPDFFRNARLVVYGTYENESDFSMRLLGDIEGRTKELIFKGDLKKAKDGTQDIATAWAFNKIYYLISRATLGGRDEEAEAEIRALSKKFNITTPYDLADDESD